METPTLGLIGNRKVSAESNCYLGILSRLPYPGKEEGSMIVSKVDESCGHTMTGNESTGNQTAYLRLHPFSMVGCTSMFDNNYLILHKEGTA